MEKIIVTNVQGRDIAHRDVVLHTTSTKFSFWDRIKILLGRPVSIDSEIYTMNERVDVVCSSARAKVARLFPSKVKRGGCEIYIPKDPKEIK